MRVKTNPSCQTLSNLTDSGLWRWQDKLLEEMWKQQDSLDAPAATTAAAAETPGDATEGGGASDDGSKDSNPLLERLRALEVKRAGKLSSPPLLSYLNCEKGMDSELSVIDGGEGV